MSVIQPKTDGTVVTISGNITEFTTTINLITGDGAKFNALIAKLNAGTIEDGYLYGRIWNPSTNPIPSDYTNNEFIRFLISDISGNSLTNVERGQLGTSANSHSSGSRIIFGLTTKDIDDINDRFDQIENKLQYFIGYKTQAEIDALEEASLTANKSFVINTSVPTIQIYGGAGVWY